MKKYGKKHRKAAELVDQSKKYGPAEACEIVKKTATAKFDETVEVAVKLGVDPRHADQMIRGAVVLPAGTGKTQRVAVFCRGEKQQQAKDAGADFVGAEDLVEKVQGGWLDFDVAVASPDMMALVGRLGKVLGPRGLMPSPKAGTVTPNVGQAVTDIKKGKIEFRVDKNANIHVPVGKASFSPEQIRENAVEVIRAIIKAKPSSCKGVYLKSCCMSSTMGPGFRLDVASLASQLN